MPQGLEPADKWSVALAGAALCLAALQTLPLRAEHQEERLGSRWTRAALAYAALWLLELVAFFCAVLNSAVQTLLLVIARDSEWQHALWLAWAATALLLLAWLSEFLAFTIKARASDLAYELRRAHAATRPRVPLDRPEDEPHARDAWPLLAVAAGAAAAAVGAAAAALAVAAQREEDFSECRDRVVSTPVLAGWAVTTLLCYGAVVSMQLFLWDACLGRPLAPTIARLPGLYTFELALAAVEAVPAIFVSSLALVALAPSAITGCETIGRRLAVIGLMFAVGPVAKVVRQVGRRVCACRPPAQAVADAEPGAMPRARRRRGRPGPPSGSGGPAAGTGPSPPLPAADLTETESGTTLSPSLVSDSGGDSSDGEGSDSSQVEPAIHDVVSV